MKTTIISPRFKIPKGYFRAFTANREGVKHYLVFSSITGIEYSHNAKDGIGNISQCLDWVFECFETAKKECETP